MLIFDEFMKLHNPSFAKKGKHNAMLKVLKHGIMCGIFRRRCEKYHAKARACAFFPLKEKAREKCFGRRGA
ncbi:MAG: hypothetical protein H7829_17605 [Magnetococcus sp. THC-1_WYH]